MLECMINESMWENAWYSFNNYTFHYVLFALLRKGWKKKIRGKERRKKKEDIGSSVGASWSVKRKRETEQYGRRTRWISLQETVGTSESERKRDREREKEKISESSMSRWMKLENMNGVGQCLGTPKRDIRHRIVLAYVILRYFKYRIIFWDYIFNIYNLLIITIYLT